MDRGNQNINDNINDNSRDQGSEGSMGVNTYQKNTFNDDVFYGLARRAERIATALYMVSNFISKDAVLRKDMRRHWMRVVKDLYKCMICDAYDQQFYLEEALVSIEYVASTLRIATATGSISEMNKNILDKAMISLGGQIKVQLQIALRYEQDFSRDVAPAIDKDTLLGFLQETVDSDSVANTEFQQALQEAISVKKTFKTTQNDKYLKRQTKRQVVVKSSNVLLPGYLICLPW